VTGLLVMRLSLFVVIIPIAGVANARDYASGQLWSYKTRSGDESSRVLINTVESVPRLGTIYHITVFRVRMPSLNDGSREMTDIAHLPVSKATLDTSLIGLVGKRAPFSEYRSGYEQWRKAFDSGNAGAFTISLAEAIAGIEAGIRQERVRMQQGRSTP
jgi:hypothetical protein